LALGDEYRAVRRIPGRDLMAPPQLPRDTPGLDVAHPLEERVLPLPRHELSAAALDRLDRGFRQLAGVAVPLVGQPGLDHDTGAVVMRHRQNVVLDLVGL